MRKEIFQNTLVFIQLNEGRLVPLRLQLSEKNLAVRAAEKRGVAGEESLDLLESLHQLLDRMRILHQSMTRKTDEGRCIDMVVIPYKKE